MCVLLPSLHLTYSSTQTQTLRVYKSEAMSQQVKVGYFQWKVQDLKFSLTVKKKLCKFVLSKTQPVFTIVLPCCLSLCILASLWVLACTSVMESEFLSPHRLNTLWLSSTIASHQTHATGRNGMYRMQWFYVRDRCCYWLLSGCKDTFN